MPTPPLSGSAPFPPPQRPRRVAGAWAALAAAVFLSAVHAQAPEAAAPPSVYAGSEACALCHEDIAKAFKTSRHGVLDEDKKRGWEAKACEACHGAGAKHAESATAAEIRNPAKLAVAETDRACLTCHANGPTHVGRIQGGHARNQVACTSCHTVHHAPTAKVVAPAANIGAQNTRCAECHTSVVAEFKRPYKHRVPEGTMGCVDCHNPHGSFLAGSLRTVSANEPGCLRCHGDKRGPFAFEHAPVRLEGCSSCHQPHGSANPKMLTRPVVGQLCLECHANLGAQPASTIGGIPPAFHDLRNVRFQNCTLCHVKVHGSHVNRALLR